MRRSISGKRHSRKFNKARSRSKAINSPTYHVRGGIRL